jgi:alanine racemase
MIFSPMFDSVLDDDHLVLRPTTVYVELAALRHNLAVIKNRVGRARVMAIVKANAYGHGLIRTSKELLASGADALGVAFLEEGIALRRAGVTAPILVLGGIIGNQIAHFLEYDLEITASSPFKLQQIEEIAKETNKRAKIHLKIDTGMERIGIHHDNAPKLFEAAVAAKHCDLAGVFSHFACCDSADKTFTRLQLERFEHATSWFERRSLPVPPRHIASSGAVLQHPDSFFDMVRPGLILYGIYPGDEVERSIALEPALSLKTRVVYFKVVKEGSPVSYGGTWVAKKDTRVVTLPVGYGDGYGRLLSGKAEVLIHGRRHPVIGRITMDAMMVDIDGHSAFNGDEVTLIGKDGGDRISCEELARHLGTIPYEVLTSINTRVPRKYV